MNEATPPPDGRCRHCGLPLPAQSSALTREGFCCTGCKAVNGILGAGGLDRYYELRSGPGVAIGELRDADRTWLEEAKGKTHLDVDIQGMHCAGCVWVLEELFARHGQGRIELDPTLGRAALLLPEGYDLPGFVTSVEALGYRLGPAGEDRAPASDALLIRVGICLALAGNGMLYAAANYFGLTRADGTGGEVYRLLSQMGYGAALLSVLVGGSVFIKAAWQAARRGLIHLDLPIALGVLLSFGGATYSYFDRGEARFVDTVTIFIALMLLGRWLQERMLERNRRQLLADHGAASLRTRRVEEDGPVLRPVTDIVKGDVLQLGAGDLVPVESTLEGEASEFSFDWIDGESTARRIDNGERVVAGAFHVGASTRRIRAQEDFATSAVKRLLQRTRETESDPGLWWQIVARWYVVGVLLVAVGAFFTWLEISGITRAIEVATAVLVVTCPCSFGIATPLAYDLAHATLRRVGLFVRTRFFLDRLTHVKRVVFDKTGTLTTGALEIREDLSALSEDERSILFALASGSLHPKSQVVVRAIQTQAPTVDRRYLEIPVTEYPGQGVEFTSNNVYRLGSASFVGAVDLDADIVFAEHTSGRVILAIHTEEILRPDAAREIERLKQRGLRSFILSGDRQARVTELARFVDVAPEDALGDHSPTQKADYIAAHDPQRTLMIGDGLNDSLAVTTASCAGTPAIDRPFIAARSDFYFTTPGLSPVLDAFETAFRLRTVVRVLLAFAIAYNVLAVAIAWAGWMEPWLAAVLMPASSILSIAYTILALRSRR